MEKTVESYAAARRQVLPQGPAVATPQPAAEPEPVPVPAAAAAAQAVRGMRDLKGSEENVRKNTGRSWNEWFAILDDWDATQRSHTEIARWLMAEHEIGGWWAQGITIGYEQARGIRAPGETSGGFTAGGSRTVNVPAADLFSAFADGTTRDRWLPGVSLTVRVARAPKSFRADWVTTRGTASRLIVTIDPAGPAKSRTAVSHERLADPDELAELKAFWKDRLSALKILLEP